MASADLQNEVSAYSISEDFKVMLSIRGIPGVNVASGPLAAIAGGPIDILSAGKWSGPLAAIAAIVSGPLVAIAIF